MHEKYPGFSTVSRHTLFDYWAPNIKLFDLHLSHIKSRNSLFICHCLCVPYLSRETTLYRAEYLDEHYIYFSIVAIKHHSYSRYQLALRNRGLLFSFDLCIVFSLLNAECKTTSLMNNYFQRFSSSLCCHKWCCHFNRLQRKQKWVSK